MGSRTLMLAALLTLACRAQDPVASAVGGGAGGGAGGAGAGGAPAGDGGLPAFCEGSGPLVLVGDSITVGGGGPSGDICSGLVAERTFRFALCTCEGYASATTLTTDSFDSSLGPYRAGRAGGAVGTNGGFSANGTSTIGGSLWIGSAAGATLGALLDVAAELQDAGGLAGATAPVRVRRDARVAGDLDLGELVVGGTLTVPEGRAITVRGQNQVGALVRAPVAVSAPCACAPGDLVDIAGLVAAHRQANENTRVGLDPRALDGFSSDTELALPCGRFYLDAIRGTGALTLRVTGRAALLVAGDVRLERPLEVDLAPGAEIDLLVGGVISSDQRIRFGSGERPARARLYVGGEGRIELAADALLGGNVYAPRAELVLSGPAEVFGALFVRRLVAAAPVVIHYDTAVLDAGQGCPTPPPARCEGCLDCRNQACIDGACAACRDSNDCCAPLQCFQGVCVPEVT